MKVPKHIFRQYDIRGVWGEDLDAEIARAIGRAYGSFLRERGVSKAVVGHDNRLSSPEAYRAVVDGLLSTGCDVVGIGETITPILYFSRVHYGIEGGVMVTASHNPPQYNGFKLCWGHGTLFGDDIGLMREIIESEKFKSGEGSFSERDANSDYADYIASHIKLGPRKLRVVVDAGNGTAGPIAPKILRRLGCEVIELYCDSDPTFPNHHPDPVKLENLKDLISKVRETGADVGLGLDGDGDRLGVVDENGQVIWGDYLLILFAREVLRKHPGAKVVVEVKCSKATMEEIKKAGGVPVMCRTGHSFIKEEMRAKGAILAGEMSGHFFFADEYFGFDDAVYAACRLLRILSNTERKLSELLADVPKYPSTPEVRVRCPDEVKFEVVRKLTEGFKREHEVIDIDGARVLFKEGWGLVRASNTEPALILRAEAETKEGLERIKGEIAERLKKLGVEVDW
ncbi:phosphomannomutase [Candidatus Poribacteria bacterium]|nr:MAG: phosphomannomutase [Candidatus Poribacteria bacterium]